MKAIYPFQRKEKKVVKTYLPPSCGRGMPEGQGVGRRAGGWPKVKESKANLRRYGRLLAEEGGRRECRFPRIVISSASEKSFSFAVEQEKGGERKTGNPVLQASGDPHVRNG